MNHALRARTSVVLWRRVVELIDIDTKEASNYLQYG